MKLQQILVPTDFSQHSQASLKYACDLAALAGARIHLLHVLDLQVSPVPEFGLGLAMPHWIEESRTGAEQSLASMTAEIPVPGPSVSKHVVQGTPAAAIVDYARKEQIDLIVMSTHGRTGLAHVLLGSVAEGVIHKAPCPVLTTRPDTGSA